MKMLWGLPRPLALVIAFAVGTLFLILASTYGRVPCGRTEPAVTPPQDSQSDVKKEFGLLSTAPLPKVAGWYRLDSYCDAPNSNLVYVAASDAGISVAVVFDPERCAAPKEAK